jgi:ParB family chromosome partitioning protein
MARKMRKSTAITPVEYSGLQDVIDIPSRRDLFSNADRDAVEIGELYRKAKSSVVDSVRYLLEAGHRLMRKKQEVGHGNWLPWLEANADVLGFDNPRTPQRLMTISGKYDAGVAFDETKAFAISREIWGHNVRGTQGTGKNEWFTPPEYIELARTVLGTIDLDPATHAEAQKIVQATTFFTKEQDGLKQEWHGRVWLNPPYVQPLIEDFVMKLLVERRAGRVAAAIMVTHNYTSSAWFQTALAVTDAICFPRSRIGFIELDNDKLADPTQGQAFFYFGSEVDKFLHTFRSIGAASRWQPNGERAPAR